MSVIQILDDADAAFRISGAELRTVLSATTMLADKPHRLNGRTSVQRVYVLTILPPVTALTVGLPAQRAIAQRFSALARLKRADVPCECPLIGVDRKWLADRQNDANDPLRTYRNRKRLKRPRREALRLNYGSPFVAVKGLNPRSARAAHEAAPRCGNRK